MDDWRWSYTDLSWSQPQLQATLHLDPRLYEQTLHLKNFERNLRDMKIHRKGQWGFKIG